MINDALFPAVTLVSSMFSPGEMVKSKVHRQEGPLLEVEWEQYVICVLVFSDINIAETRIPLCNNKINITKMSWLCHKAQSSLDISLKWHVLLKQDNRNLVYYDPSRTK